jgi:hypothetical protein
LSLASGKKISTPETASAATVSVTPLFNRMSGVKSFRRQTEGPARRGIARADSLAFPSDQILRRLEAVCRERGCFRGRQKPPHNGLRRNGLPMFSTQHPRNCIQS